MLFHISKNKFYILSLAYASPTTLESDEIIKKVLKKIRSRNWPTLEHVIFPPAKIVYSELDQAL